VQSLSPTKLGMVIEDLEHVLALQKHLGSNAVVSPLGALKIWGYWTSQIKTPITPEPLRPTSLYFST